MSSRTEHVEAIARYAVVLMERGVLRPSRGLSSQAITITLQHARANQATRAAGIALAHGADREIREAFKTSTPPPVNLP